MKLRAYSFSAKNSSAPVISEKPSVQSNPIVRLTYLEGNNWLWDVGGLSILMDPILVGNLDFGVLWLYDAAKKILKKLQLEDLPEVDCLLITLSLDDHCHVNTLKPHFKMRPDLWVIATQNAESILNPMFRNWLFPIERSSPQQGACLHRERTRCSLPAGPLASSVHHPTASGEEAHAQRPSVPSSSSVLPGNDGSSGEE